MNLIFSWFVRSASKIPLMPSPGKPKIVSTPHSMRRSMSKSAVVLAMVASAFLFLFPDNQRQGAESGCSQQCCHALVLRKPGGCRLLVSLLSEYAVCAEI